MPKAISKGDMAKFNTNNNHDSLRYRMSTVQLSQMGEGSYCIVQQHVLVDDQFVRCIVMAPSWQGDYTRTVDFTVEDFNRLPEAADILKEMQNGNSTPNN